MDSSKSGWSGIGAGIWAYTRSFGAIRNLRLQRAYVWSAALTVLFVLLGAYAINWAVDKLGSAYRLLIGLDSSWPEGEGIWRQFEWVVASAGEYALQVIAFAALFWVKIKLTKYLVIAFLGPVMAWASERAESGISGRERVFNWKQQMRELVRGARSATLLFAIEFSLGLLLFGLSVLATLFSGPFSLILSPVFLVISFSMGAWFYGASVFDFIWERRGMGARKGLRASWGVRGKVLGVGIPFQLWMMVPVLSWFIAPIFAPVTCAVAAVLVYAKGELRES
jgi:CysZ protein